MFNSDCLKKHAFTSYCTKAHIIEVNYSAKKQDSCSYIKLTLLILKPRKKSKTDSITGDMIYFTQ